jgi:hypothetical protein
MRFAGRRCSVHQVSKLCACSPQSAMWTLRGLVRRGFAWRVRRAVYEVAS